MEFSGNQIKHLGKRLRDGEASDADIRMLEEYRASFDPLLIGMSLKLDQLLLQSGISYLMSGRSKRTKSITRKLQRPQNRGMDLSRISDLVGLRVLVETVRDQEIALETITSALPTKDLHDYRDNPALSGYRSVHLIVRDEHRLLEIQLRTLAQHLWAVESETFGEKVKEGTATGETGEYLKALAQACVELDRGKKPTEAAYPAPFMEVRKPFHGAFSRRRHLFQKATSADARNKASTTYIIVFDRSRGELLHEFPFKENERDEAIKEYSKFSAKLDDNEVDILIINSPSRVGIEVTHPQFF